MAHSLSVAGPQREAVFESASSGTKFTIQSSASGIWQTAESKSEVQKLRVDYVVGSGSHAFGYLAQVGNHLLQSPLSFYSIRNSWDLAPGYEDSSKPDFSRPVTPECLSCHAGKARPIADTLNSYRSPPFEQTEIGCDRCHGPADAHLRNPAPGSIINPSKLQPAARDSICEQCHLAGEVRIPNPGKTLVDFQPGKKLEDAYTVYVAGHDPEKTVKVISQSEQLALSRCARSSAGRLWCGTCHNPHETPVRPAEYFRERCLSCHAKTLPAEHAARTNDCISCHMPRRPAKDGGHTAFTDHRISRHPEAGEMAVATSELVAWREPDPSLRQRNLGMALVTLGIQNGSSDQVVRGYKVLNRSEKEFPNDPATLTALGSILLTAKEPAEAQKRFEHALQERPDYAPYEVNLAASMMALGNIAGATLHLQRALDLDPLLIQGVQLLDQLYRQGGQADKSEKLLSDYRHAMGITLNSGK